MTTYDHYKLFPHPRCASTPAPESQYAFCHIVHGVLLFPHHGLSAPCCRNPSFLPFRAHPVPTIFRI